MEGRLLGGRYRVGGLLGSGGMGDVHAAIDERIGARVAIKLLRPGEADTVALQRFRREARAAAALGNPHIVRVTDFQESPDEPPFIVMERVEGVSLRALIQHEGRLKPQRACTIAAQILAALSAAHDAGILHRDIKPANVLVMASPAGDLVKVADFGLARLLEHAETAPVRGALPARLRLTGTDDLVGTVGFIAPEHLRGESSDGRADLYAVGATLFQLLSGSRPFEGLRPEEYVVAALAQVPRLDAAALGIDTALVEVVAKSMALRPEDRFGSASAFMTALEPWLDVTATMTLTAGMAASPSQVPPRTPGSSASTAQTPLAHAPPSRALRSASQGPIFWLLTIMVVGLVGLCIWYIRLQRKVADDYKSMSRKMQEEVSRGAQMRP